MPTSGRHNFETLSDAESDTEILNTRTTKQSSSQANQDGNSSTAGARMRPKEHWCFSTKTAITVVIVTLLLATLLVIILDLTILEVEREARVKEATAYLDHDKHRVSKNDKGEITFFMNGTDDSDTIQVFESIKDKWWTNHVYLSNIEINPHLLSKELGNTDSLRTVSLINVTLFGRMGSIINDVVIPNLAKYTLELNEPIGPKELLRLTNKNCSVSDIMSALTFSTFQDKDCVRSLIFFRTDYDTPKDWKIEQVYLLNTTIRITIFGFHLFLIDPVEGELTSVLNYTEDILLSIANDPKQSFKLRKLNLRTCPLQLSTLTKFAGQLTQLHLGSINFNEPSSSTAFTSTLRQFKSLKRFYFMGYGSPFNSQLERIDLADITTTVQELRLGLVELDFTNLISDSTPKFSLDHLYLHHVGIKNTELVTKFHLLFDVQKVYFDGKNYGQNPFSRFELFLNIMKMNKIEFVLFDDSSYHFGGRVSPASTQFQTTAINATIQELLRNIDVSLNIAEPFILKRDNGTQKWTGRNYNASSEKDKIDLYFEGGNVDETFLNIATFLKLRFSKYPGDN